MMNLRAYRFDGIRLEPIEGSFVTPTGWVRRPDQRTISFGPPSDLRTPIGAILIVDVTLQPGEEIDVGGSGLPMLHEQHQTFRHTYVIAPGAEIHMHVYRRGGTITTSLRCENDELTIAHQDKPAGC